MPVSDGVVCTTSVPTLDPRAVTSDDSRMASNRRFADGAECRRYVARREALTRAELLERGRDDDELHARPWPAGVHVYVIDPNGAERQLPHAVRHSPDGFDYGYGGSAPADLARAILIDFFALHETPDLLPVSYQEFKWRFIAHADRDASTLEIDGADIAAWARQRRRDDT
jgi:hypothetical protein